VSLPLTGERTLPGVASEHYWFRRHVAAYRWANRIAGPGPVLDAGAGEGYGAGLLARRRRVAAVELDHETARHIGAAYRGVGVVRADCCALPLGVGRLGDVVCLQVIEHLHCAERFVADCARALLPGGRLILSTPNRATFPEGMNPFHTHEYTAAELEGLLRTAFAEVRVGGLRHRAPLAALDRFLGEPVQHRLVRRPYQEQPWWLRAVLRSVTSRDFRVGTDPTGALDLLAVARGSIEP
jgi:SAM-dependent methyltransferase